MAGRWVREVGEQDGKVIIVYMYKLVFYVVLWAVLDTLLIL